MVRLQCKLQMAISSDDCECTMWTCPNMLTSLRTNLKIQIIVYLRSYWFLQSAKFRPFISKMYSVFSKFARNEKKCLGKSQLYQIRESRTLGLARKEQIIILIQLSKQRLNSTHGYMKLLLPHG